MKYSYFLTTIYLFLFKHFNVILYSANIWPIYDKSAIWICIIMGECWFTVSVATSTQYFNTKLTNRHSTGFERDAI